MHMMESEPVIQGTWTLNQRRSLPACVIQDVRSHSWSPIKGSRANLSTSIVHMDVKGLNYPKLVAFWKSTADLVLVE